MGDRHLPSPNKQKRPDGVDSSGYNDRLRRTEIQEAGWYFFANLPRYLVVIWRLSRAGACDNMHCD